MMGFVFTSGRTPEMACTECVPFLRRLIHKIKNKKGNEKTCSCTFFDVKVLQRNMRRGLFLCVLGQLQTSLWLHLPEDWKRKRQFWVCGYCAHVYTKCGNYPCSLIFPTASLLLAEQMFLTGYCLAVCKHLLPETFPRAWRLLVHRCLSPEVLGFFCDPNSCTPHLKVSFLLSACLV